MLRHCFGKPLRFWLMGAIAALITVLSGAIVLADQPLFVAYPPDGHETTASKIFLIGTAPPNGDVTVNGQPIRRSPAGHFAPSFSLEVGDNLFTLRHDEQELTIRVNRLSAALPTPTGTAFAEGSLTPAVDIARLPGETICFEAIAPANATVSVTINTQIIPLLPQSSATDLPPNSAVLTDQNQPISTNAAQRYQGCAPFTQIGDLGQPQFQLVLGGQTIRQAAPGRVTILAPTNPAVVEVTVPSGTARTGPSTDYSRLTPLPTGTRAAVTGQEGEWWRLDYGAWIRAIDVQVVPNAALPQTLIRSITSRQVEGATEVIFPLQVPVPVTVQQGDRTFTLTLHNITAQTDTIFLNDDPLIERLDWQQPAPGKVQYTFNLKSNQQWGYSLRYEGTSLILSLRHPPVLEGRSLAGATILLDPGHGGPEDLGSRGPTGYPEKDVALAVSLLLRDELVQRGATVPLTREADVDVPLQDRVNLINQVKPTIALSVHYNALPDNGDAENTAGIGTFWYNTQAHSLAVFLHNYLVEKGDRPSYGVFWNNLALTRPTITPSVLLELGFMINPNEFEWIVNPTAQRRLANTLADGIEEWLKGENQA